MLKLLYFNTWLASFTDMRGLSGRQLSVQLERAMALFIFFFSFFFHLFLVVGG